MVEFDERHADYYVVNLETGKRQILAEKQRNAFYPSPDAKHAVSFNGKDWVAVSLADGKSVNLTAGFGVAFFNEEFDSPGTPTPYGIAGWTKDSQHVLLYDRYDIWEFRPAGGAALNLTASLGRREKLQLRYVRFGQEERAAGPPDRF